MRLKAYRRGQQDIEYLVLLAARKGWDREAVTRAVAGAVDLSSEVTERHEEDAGEIRFTKLQDADFEQLRLRVAKALTADAR
ncbi:MAG: hypothetical protein JNL98_31530 [Bryobacterales bacterium]|nr:hypothetical protein [Bryobacterales bacterium]